MENEKLPMRTGEFWRHAGRDARFMNGAITALVLLIFVPMLVWGFILLKDHPGAPTAREYFSVSAQRGRETPPASNGMAGISQLGVDARHILGMAQAGFAAGVLGEIRGDAKDDEIEYLMAELGAGAASRKAYEEAGKNWQRQYLVTREEAIEIAEMAKANSDSQMLVEMIEERLPNLKMKLGKDEGEARMVAYVIASDALLMAADRDGDDHAERRRNIADDVARRLRGFSVEEDVLHENIVDFVLGLSWSNPELLPAISRRAEALDFPPVKVSRGRGGAPAGSPEIGSLPKPQ